ncbi:MAG TPA: Spy/CpxP family protein refolding chaperone, partial [Candidatus Acidoferrum sp.]|nr:Spy/CpxP family protein refolding chaperone [Candidatus Acidoferrum sp.]
PSGSPGMARRFGPGGQMNGPGGGMRGQGARRGHRRHHRRYHRRPGFAGQRGAMGFRGGMGMRGGFAGRPGGMGMGPGGMRAGGGRGMRPGFGPGGMGMRPGMGGRGEMGLARFVNNPNMRQQLGITDEQVAKFHTMNEDFQKAGIQNRATMQIKRMELNDLLRADKPDRAAIDRKLGEVNAAQAASEKAIIDHMLAMRTILTPDQQAKIKTMMQDRPGPGMGPGMGPGRGGRGGPGQNKPPQVQPQKQPGGDSGSSNNSRTTT